MIYIIYILFILQSINGISILRLNKNNINMKNENFQYHPRTSNQNNYYKALKNKNNELIIGTGPAGTGKTLFACQAAVNALALKNIEKIIITRPLKSVENEQLGYLPGTIKDKLDPWTRPIIDTLNELLSKEVVDKMLRSQTIELSPLAFMRGRTFKNAFIIADEMQNSSPTQMRMLTTRIGENSKLVINGDINQSDYNNEDNGLKNLLDKINIYNHEYIDRYLKKRDNIIVIQMNSSDIQRSSIVRTILDIYDYTPINRKYTSSEFYPAYVSKENTKTNEYESKKKEISEIKDRVSNYNTIYNKNIYENSNEDEGNIYINELDV